MNKSQEIEFKCYGFYSTVANELGCKASDVDTVYSWYLDSTVRGLTEEPALQVMLRGIGALKINLKKALSYLKGYTLTLEELVDYYYNDQSEKRTKIKVQFLNRRCLSLMNTAKTLKSRIEKMKEADLINETNYLNKITTVEKFQNQLNTIYESIQRIPEYELKRSPQCRQSSEWGDDKSSTEI